MKWHAQVLHVARKDLRLSRWLLLAYAAVVTAATAAAAEWGGFAVLEPLLSTLGLMLMGTILIAHLVQADSPARGDSLWVTLPLQPSAVFAAKLVLGAVVLVGVPLLGQLVALRAHQVAPADLPALLAHSALSYGGWLVVAAVIAALTPDLRSFFVVLIISFVAWQLGARFVLIAAEPSARSGSNTLPLTAVGMLLLLAHQYLTRNVRRGALMAAVLAVSEVALLAVPARSAAPLASPARAMPGHLRPASIEFGAAPADPGMRPAFEVHLAGISPSHHYVLVTPTARIHMADGSSAAVRFRDRVVSLNMPAPRVEGFRTLGETRGHDRYTTGIALELSTQQRQALAEGKARLSLKGRLEVRELRTRVDLPLRAGARAADGGRRVRITSVASLPEGPVVEVRTSEVGSRGKDGAGESMYGAFTPEYLLVNRSRREALPMRQTGSSGSDLALVLTGPRAQSSTAELVADDQRPDEAVRIGAEWLGGARLRFVSWVPVGSEQIAIEDRGRGYEDWAAESASPRRGR